MPVYFEPRLIKVGLAAGVTEDDLDEAADEATLGLDDVERARIEKSVAVDQRRLRRARPARRRSRRTSSRTGTIRSAAMDQVHRVARQGDHRRRHPRDLRQALRGDRRAASRLARRRRRQGRDQGRLLRFAAGHRARRQARPPRRARTRRSSSGCKDPDDELQIVIVKDMMLTGFDAPPLHTLYLDRPLKGALLMQTLARVNRTFRGKPDGPARRLRAAGGEPEPGPRRVHGRGPRREAGRQGHRRGRRAARQLCSVSSTRCARATTGVKARRHPEGLGQGRGPD